ncbi:hypothetical protein TNCV_4843281 [Trichonephila clavipes]|uniref:Uncharacterized protein n=1 Tax=Trichonephila clavipes TaxID=2585209 RepID=A0A8X7BL45_TRICX|nr:hypothetical protein TNCV_4843281 [Trichonephila clavipes]
MEKSTAPMWQDYAAHKRSLEYLFGLGTLDCSEPHLSRRFTEHWLTDGCGGAPSAMVGTGGQHQGNPDQRNR